MTASDPQEIDITNEFLVGVGTAGYGADSHNVLRVNLLAGPQISTRQNAYRLAGWLIACAEILPDDGTGHTFEEIKSAIENS